MLSQSVKHSNSYFLVARERMQSPTVKKTTPRKVPKSKLVWQVEVVEDFVKLCVKKKAELRGERIPLKTWKDIAEDLNVPGVNWQTCRDKYDIMKQIFVDTLIPLVGTMAGIKWPYYDGFCDIFEVPQNAHKMMVYSEEPQVEPGNPGMFLFLLILQCETLAV